MLNFKLVGLKTKSPPMYKVSAGEGGGKGSVRFAHRPLTSSPANR